MKKKIGLILLGLTLCVSIAGCGKSTDKKDDKQTTDSEAVTTIADTSHTETTKGGTEATKGETETSENVTLQSGDSKKSEAEQEFLNTLDEVDSLITLGTAGSSLKVVKATVSLMNLSVGTTLTKEQVKNETNYWLSSKDADTKSEFIVKLKNIDSTYKTLLTDGQEELLASAGCEDAPYPWSKEPLDTMEALMEAAGLR